MSNDIKEACKAVKQFLSVSPDVKHFFIGDWISINDNDIIKSFSEKTWDNSAALQSLCLDFAINKINDHSYGAGCHYELFESRRQETICFLLEILSGRISSNDLAILKKRCDYNEDTPNEIAQCDQCADSVDACEMARSIQYVDEILCAYCCNSAML